MADASALPRRIVKETQRLLSEPGCQRSLPSFLYLSPSLPPSFRLVACGEWNDMRSCSCVIRSALSTLHSPLLLFLLYRSVSVRLWLPAACSAHDIFNLSPPPASFFPFLPPAFLSASWVLTAVGRQLPRSLS
eukprot:scaffold38504_cov24-Tisochrysis_lutea.AAC.1